MVCLWSVIVSCSFLLLLACSPPLFFLPSLPFPRSLFLLFFLLLLVVVVVVVERNRRRNTRDKAEEEAETHTGKQRRTNKTQAQQTKQKLSAAKHHTRKAAERAKKKRSITKKSSSAICATSLPCLLSFFVDASCYSNSRTPALLVSAFDDSPPFLVSISSSSL